MLVSRISAPDREYGRYNVLRLGVWVAVWYLDKLHRVVNFIVCHTQKVDVCELGSLLTGVGNESELFIYRRMNALRGYNGV